jgi:small subunit ribosomal protein S11
VIASASCGALGFNGSRKSTVYAATRVGEEVANQAMQQGAREAEVVVKGIGVGRQATIKGVRAAGLKITSIADQTAVPHGGCKPRRMPKK